MNQIKLNPNRTFLFVRAGATELDDQERILGSLDIPLSQRGEEGAKATAAELMAMHIGTIVSANCQAAQQTARLIASQLNSKCKVKVERKLTNLDCGLWHGKSLSELRDTHPNLFKQWKEHPDSVCPPEGETLARLKSRIESAVEKIVRKNVSEILVFVAHEPLLGAIKSILCNDCREQQNKALNGTKCGSWELVKTPD